MKKTKEELLNIKAELDLSWKRVHELGQILYQEGFTVRLSTTKVDSCVDESTFFISNANLSSARLCSVEAFKMEKVAL